MDRLMSRMFGVFVLSVMLIFAAGTAYSQKSTTQDHMTYKTRKSMTQDPNYDKDVSHAASQLSKEVNLSKEQMKQVEGFLQNYKNDMSMKNMTASKSNTMDKITGVLTADQKTKFDNVKMNWWSNTEKMLSKDTKSSMMDKNWKKKK